MPLLARRAASATERTLVYFRMTMYMRPPMRLSSSPTHQSISGRCWTRAYFRDGSFGSFDPAPFTSGLPCAADIGRVPRQVSKVPKPEISPNAKLVDAPSVFPRRGGFDLSLGRGFATSRAHWVNNSVTRLIDRCR